MRFIDALLLCGLFFASCRQPEEPQECREDLTEQSGIADTLPPVPDVTGDNLLKHPAKPSKEKQENHDRIVRKYGTQWDFCACVTANDSINKASQRGLKEKQAEKLMERWELVEKKCREFMTGPNTTPDERALHEKKVKKCLEAQ